MTLSEYCKACGSEIALENQFENSCLCECGWSQPRSEHIKRTRLTQTIGFKMGLFCLGFVVSVLHIFSWDNHALRIIPLKAKQVVGIANAHDLRKVADICKQRSKHDCRETALKDLYKVAPNQLATLEELGHLQMLRKKLTDAEATLKLYFENNGNSPEAGYDYARVLTQLGHYPEAEKYYQMVMKSKQDSFQISVARSYIEALMAAKKWSTAMKQLEKFRRLSSSSSLFMEKEYQAIKVQVGAKRGLASRS